MIVRPAFILGGGGTGIAHDRDEMLQRRRARPRREPDLARSSSSARVAGWKEYELEVMRDHADNVVVICSIENLDPMGVHTGESITVAPAQTLTDVEYQRDARRRVRVHPPHRRRDRRFERAVRGRSAQRRAWSIIEMNPRVSRSSALASKATGFPIAKIAAKLAVGYRLDEVRNDITRETPASFEPTIDYVVTKVPRWAFEKLPGAAPVLGTQMQSVGEVMAIGRTFPESLQKALRSLETGRARAQLRSGRARARRPRRRRARARRRGPDAGAHLPGRGRAAAVRVGRAAARGHRRSTRGSSTRSSRSSRNAIGSRELGLAAMTRADWRQAKRHRVLPTASSRTSGTVDADAVVRAARLAAGVRVTYKTVDTCAAEFAAFTPYHYGTYEDEDELAPLDAAAPS